MYTRNKQLETETYHYRVLLYYDKISFIFNFNNDSHFAVALNIRTPRM